MRVKFYGHSDDCLELEIDSRGSDIKDEWGCYLSGGRHGLSDVHAIARVATIGGTRAVHVHAVYDGGWSFAVGKAGANVDDTGDDALPLPPWSFTIIDEHAYSTALIINTGDDLVEVTRVGGDK